MCIYIYTAYILYITYIYRVRNLISRKISVMDHFPFAGPDLCEVYIEMC